jgi:polyphosphate kinase
VRKEKAGGNHGSRKTLNSGRRGGEHPAALEENQETRNLDHPSLYINRELSWLEFNRRVLEEALDKLTPSLEKLKFVSIFSSNLDEYFMVRVGGLFRVLSADINGIDASGRTIRQQLDEIAEKVRELVSEQYRCIREEVLPQIEKAGIFLHRIDDLDKKESKRLDEFFESQVFPILTPLAVDAGHPFPYLGNLRLNLMAVFKEASGIKIPQAYAFVEVPSVLPRLIPVNTEMKGHHFIPLEDIIRRHIHELFPGMEIKNITGSRETMIMISTKMKSWIFLSRLKPRSGTARTRWPSGLRLSRTHRKR